MTIKTLSEKLRKKEISSVELTEEYLKNIDHKDEKIHAYLTVTKEKALLAAEKADELIKRGKRFLSCVVFR